MYIFIIEMQKKVIMCLKMWKRPSLLCWVHVLEENLLYTLSRVERRNSILVPVFPLLQKKKPLELPFLKAFYSHYWEKLFWRNYIISIMNSTRYKYWCMGRQKKKEGQKKHIMIVGTILETEPYLLFYDLVLFLMLSLIYGDVRFVACSLGAFFVHKYCALLWKMCGSHFKMDFNVDTWLEGGETTIKGEGCINSAFPCK